MRSGSVVSLFETRPPGWAPPFWSMVAGLIAAVVVGAFCASWQLPCWWAVGIGHVMGGLNSGMLSRYGEE